MDKSHFAPRLVLSQNLRALLTSGRGPKSQNALHEKSKVAQATIGRILDKRGENARVETVHKLAAAYGLEGWQLMVSGMEPANPPVLQAASREERELYERLKLAAQDLAKYQK